MDAGAPDARASSEQPTERPRVSWWLLALIALGVAAWCAPGLAARAANGGHLTADEPQYVMTAISLGEDHDLDLRDERADAALPRLPPATTCRCRRRSATDGRLVSPHDPLLPAFLAVPVLVGGWVGAKLALAALAGVARRRDGVGRGRALRAFRLAAAVVTVLAFSAGAPLADVRHAGVSGAPGRARGRRSRSRR